MPSEEHRIKREARWAERDRRRAEYEAGKPYYHTWEIVHHADGDTSLVEVDKTAYVKGLETENELLIDVARAAEAVLPDLIETLDENGSVHCLSCGFIGPDEAHESECTCEAVQAALEALRDE